MQLQISTEHVYFTTPKFILGEWIGDGLILGIRWDPDADEWSYQLESPEVEGKRWIREADLER